MRVVTWVLAGVLSVVSLQATAFKLGEARFTTSFDEFVIKIKVLDVERDQKSDISGSLYSTSDLAKQFSFATVGAGKDIELVATLNEQVREPLELVLVLNFEEKTTARRYQINPSKSEPLDGSIEVTAADLKRLPVALKFDLSLAPTVYVVSQGQSLWDVSTDIDTLTGNNFQRVLALYATNRHLFDNGDINQLATRTVLAIPSQSYVSSFDATRSATVFFGFASGQLLIDAFLESTEKLATSSSIQIPTEQMILARRVRFLEQQLQELDEKYTQKFRRLDQEFDRRMRDLEDAADN